MVLPNDSSAALSVTVTLVISALLVFIRTAALTRNYIL